MTAPRSRCRQPKQLDAGCFQPEVSSFRLHLAAEGKATKTVRTYTDAAQWFAVAYLLAVVGCTGWEKVRRQDVQEWIVWLLQRYSPAYASNRFRALQQFFKWLAAEDEIADPMAGLRPPHVCDRPVPVFSAGELLRLERACAGRSFQQRRDAAVIAVFRATGMRLSELAGIRYDPDDPGCSDVDLWRREITVHGKGRKTRTVKISHDAARALDRYIRLRAGHAQAYRPQLWLGINNRGPMTASGIYQAIARRGRQCDVDVFPHRFRHHFSHTWLDRGGAEGDLMELNGWTSPQMLRRYGASARSARARRSYDRVMGDTLLLEPARGCRFRDACSANAIPPRRNIRRYARHPFNGEVCCITRRTGLLECAHWSRQGEGSMGLSLAQVLT
jgi:site-specific recombinase XerD